jgi:hypothetical protein
LIQILYFISQCPTGVYTLTYQMIIKSEMPRSMFSVYIMCNLTLDVKDIRYVVNFDFPNNIEDYVHRIGRTGRAGATGTAHTFFTMDHSKQARALVKILDEANQEVDPKLREMARGSSGGVRRPYGAPRGYKRFQYSGR